MKIENQPKPFNTNLEALNLVDSISKAKKLYQKLIIITHPDKNPDHSEKATDLTNQLNENRYNYNELLKLQEAIKTHFSQ